MSLKKDYLKSGLKTGYFIHRKRVPLRPGNRFCGRLRLNVAVWQPLWLFAVTFGNLETKWTNEINKLFLLIFFEHFVIF